MSASEIALDVPSLYWIAYPSSVSIIFSPFFNLGKSFISFSNSSLSFRSSSSLFFITASSSSLAKNLRPSYNKAPTPIAVAAPLPPFTASFGNESNFPPYFAIVLAAVSILVALGSLLLLAANSLTTLLMSFSCNWESLWSSCTSPRALAFLISVAYLELISSILGFNSGLFIFSLLIFSNFAVSLSAIDLALSDDMENRRFIADVDAKFVPKSKIVSPLNSLLPIAISKPVLTAAEYPEFLKVPIRCPVAPWVPKLISALLAKFSGTPNRLKPASRAVSLAASIFSSFLV